MKEKSISAKKITELSKNSREIAKKAGKSLEVIVPGITRTSELVQTISNASQEQDAGITQVSQHIYELNDITQYNATSAEELATTSEVLQEKIGNIKEKMYFFKT